MTQAGAAPQPVIPAPPPPPAIGVGGNVVTPNAMTSSDIGLLRSRASELSDQLSSAVRRRSSIQQQLRGAEGKDRAGLEERLGILDKRIARLESDIDENGKTLASLPAQYAGTSTPFSGMNMGRGDPMSGNFVPVAIVFTIFVLAPIAVSISRMFWRRGSMPRVAPAPADQTERLQRMEQAIDSIAIEMERVSEGQRFVTRILAEGRPGIGAGSAQPIPVPVGEQLGARR